VLHRVFLQVHAFGAACSGMAAAGRCPACIQLLVELRHRGMNFLSPGVQSTGVAMPTLLVRLSLKADLTSLVLLSFPLCRRSMHLQLN
jgi:hypothetical protein